MQPREKTTCWGEGKEKEEEETASTGREKCGGSSVSVNAARVDLVAGMVVLRATLLGARRVTIAGFIARHCQPRMTRLSERVSSRPVSKDGD